MSLINQLLKDLEKKPRQATTPAGLLAGLRSDVSYVMRGQKFYYLLIALLTLVLLVLSFLYWRAWQHHHAPVTLANQQPLRPVKAAPAKAAPTLPSEDAQLTGITLQLQQDMTYLRFMLSHNTLYEVLTDPDRHELTVIFENTRMEAELPRMNYAGSGVQNIQAYKDENHNLKLVMRLNPTAEIRRLDQSAEGQPSELQLDIQYNNAFDTIDNPPSASTIPVIIKKPIAENFPEQGYQQAIELIATGAKVQAIQRLKQVLVAAPDHEKAREYLASQLLQLGNKGEALRVLDAGLAINPSAFALIKLKARLLVDAGHVDAAIQLLEKSRPQLTSDPDYFAFIAALYQQRGQSALAETLYKKLLAVQPGNAKWWVGLGIAMESRDDQSQAFDAYTTADNIGGLDPELKSYLNSRLHTT